MTLVLVTTSKYINNPFLSSYRQTPFIQDKTMQYQLQSREMDSLINRILNDRDLPEKDIKALVGIDVNYRHSTYNMSMFTALAKRGNIDMMAYLHQRGANHFAEAFFSTNDPRIRARISSWIDGTVVKLSQASKKIAELQEVNTDYMRKNNALTRDLTYKSASLEYLEKENLLKEKVASGTSTTLEALRQENEDLKQQLQRVQKLNQEIN